MVTARAAVLSSTDAQLEIREGVLLPPPGVGQVLVRIAFSGVCHSQLMEARGARGTDRWLPHLLGHEASGTVVATGLEVDKVVPGDRVVVTWLRGAGSDAAGMRYESPLGAVNSGPVATFSEYATVPENRTVQLPAGIPMDVAVLFGCALPTGGGLVLNELGASNGSTLAIFGLGGIGLCSLMVAAATGLFSQIIAVDVADEKLKLAEGLGATAVINARNDPTETIRDLTEGVGVDFSIEASGKVEVIETAFNSVRRNGGLCVFASHPPAGDAIRIDPFELINGKQIRGSWGGGSNPDRDVPLYAEMYVAGNLPLERLLAKRYKLDQINEALADLEAGRTLRPLIEIDSTIS